ncbi:MAG TPA: DUF1572 family protein [Candidatus Acidoferrales bacterium]
MPLKKSLSKNHAQKKISIEQLVTLVSDQWKREVPDGYLPKMCDSLELLSDDEIWWRANDASNSLGNLILHLCGNMRQWIVSGLGGAEDIRQRDLEFSEQGPIPRAELIEKLRAAVREASKVIHGLSARDLVKEYSIQGFRVTGYEAAIHVTTHIAYHAGQIIYVAKMKRGKDLGFTKLPALPAKKKARA